MKGTLLGLGGLVLVLVLVTTILALFGKVVLAVAIGAGAGATFLLLVILASFGAGLMWSKQTMEAGAHIALVAQTSDDKRDIAQIKAATDLVKILMRQQEQQQPALPLPSQQAWLPELTEWEE